VDRILPGLFEQNLSAAADIVSLILDMRGYGPVKEEAVLRVRAEISDRLSGFLQVTGKAA
jgi:indolepyruvate ferredoxin oxidoreductase